MLPEITLREITAADVDQVAAWLEDEEISSRWFGYAGTDPLHRGYDPILVQMASESEWDSVFRDDPQLLVSTIYSENDERIGECQMVQYFLAIRLRVCELMTDRCICRRWVYLSVC